MRFATDFVNNGTGAVGPDSLPDDENKDGNSNVVGDGLPDFVPGLYGGVFSNPNPVVFDFGPRTGRRACSTRR